MAKSDSATSSSASAKWIKYHPFCFDKGQKPSETKIKDAQIVAKKITDIFISRFNAKKVVLFGSLARGDFSLRSDIDLAVWGIPPADFYRAVALACGFSKVWKVDVVDAEDCSKTLIDVIQKEGIRL